jgi:hypothetical protein
MTQSVTTERAPAEASFSGPRGTGGEKPGAGRRASPWAVATVIALLCGAIALVVFSLLRPEPAGFVPTAEAVPYGAADGSLRLTIDASDPTAWQYVSLARGEHVSDGAGWDLAFRRFNVIANGGAGFPGRGAIADVGPTVFEEVRVPSEASFRATTAGRDSTNAAIARWYRYGFTSHLLTPLDRSYVVRGAGGAYYAVRILGYYCPGARPGCVTIRYRPL